MVRRFQSISLHINNSIEGDNGYFNHQNVFLCVPSTSKQSHIFRNQKARGRRADRKGRKGEEERREGRERDAEKQRQYVFVHLFLDLRLQMGIHWCDWQGVNYLYLNGGGSGGGMDLHSGKSIFHTEESSSMPCYYICQCSKRRKLFLEGWWLPEMNRESGINKRVGPTDTVSEHEGQRDKVRNWKSTIISGSHRETYEILSQLIACSWVKRYPGGLCQHHPGVTTFTHVTHVLH